VGKRKQMDDIDQFERMARSSLLNRSTITPTGSPIRKAKYDTSVINVSLLPSMTFAVEPLTAVQMVMVTLPLLGVSLIRQCMLLLTTPFLEQMGMGQTISRSV
jgi:hypothetical protein